MVTGRTTPTLDSRSLWRSLQSLVVRLVGALEQEQFLERCLDAVLEQLGADRALVVSVDSEGVPHPLSARGPEGALSLLEREEISKSVIRDALDQGRTIVWDAMDGAAGSTSFHELRIASALAVPLRTAGADGARTIRGVFYIDFRDPTVELDDEHREFFEGVAAIVAAALAQNESLQAVREELRWNKRMERRSERVASIEELLRSPAMSAVRLDVQASLRSDAPLLIVGESGSGKTLLARAIAEHGGRLPVVRCMLGASDDLNTLTSELFGHERGSFSGAATRRQALAELADGGTLILDEILNLPAHAQQLLLDFAQFGTYRPLGHAQAEPRRANVRLISVTNGDVEAAVREGRFREDLYHRLAGTVVRLAPLRARREEIPTLAESFLYRFDPERGWRLSLDARRALVSETLSWPGNVRQLELVVRRARDRALTRDPEAEQIESEDLDLASSRVRESGLSHASAPVAAAEFDPANPSDSYRHLLDERRRLEELEARIIERALEKHNGVMAHAARELGVARTTLSSRSDALKIARTRRGSSGG